MAYMNQEKKKEIEPTVKAILKKYHLEGSLSVDNYSTLVLTIRSGLIDFIGNYNAVAKRYNEIHQDAWNARRIVTDGNIDTNHYYLKDGFTGDALACLEELRAAMFKGNHDNSDAMTDYFDVGWYVSITIGKWDRPYVYNDFKESLKYKELVSSLV